MSAGSTPWTRAWKPPVEGIREVFHARFTDHAYPIHSHDVWTLFIVDSGAIRYDLNGERHGADPGVASILPPHVAHDGMPAGSAGFVKRVLYVETTALGEELIGPAVDRPMLPDRRVRDRIAALHEALASPDDALEAEARFAFIAERVAELLSREWSHPRTTAVRDDERAEHLRAYLDEHLFESVTLSAAASTVGASPTQLIRAFEKAYGLPPHAYVLGRRLGAARDRILEGGSLAEVASEVGFTDQAHFTRRFKRFLGTTPGAFRRGTGAPGPRELP